MKGQKEPSGLPSKLDDPEAQPSSEHVESIEEESTGRLIEPVSPHRTSKSSSELPFVSAQEVKKHKDAAAGGLWIVIDDLVYDCTRFITEHPGGEEVIQSFAGQDCTWQFWRFHGKERLEEYAPDLRIGRTSGVKNRFEVRPRYVGLRSPSTRDDW